MFGFLDQLMGKVRTRAQQKVQQSGLSPLGAGRGTPSPMGKAGPPGKTPGQIPYEARGVVWMMAQKVLNSRGITMEAPDYWAQLWNFLNNVKMPELEKEYENIQRGLQRPQFGFGGQAGQPPTIALGPTGTTSVQTRRNVTPEDIMNMLRR